MRKILTFFVAIFTLITVYAAARPSLDGRAVVADAGEMPKGLFARTIGYLPGDSVCVTNPATGSTVDVLILGAIDANEGVAILLSPEAADVLNITKNSNVQVKITKRTGSLDETVTGSAMIAEDYDDNIVKTSMPGEYRAPAEIAPVSTVPGIGETVYAPEVLPVETAENVLQDETPSAEVSEETFENIESAVEVAHTVQEEEVEIIELTPVETVTEELPPLSEDPVKSVAAVEEENDIEELPLQTVQVVEELPVEEAPSEIVETAQVEEIPEEKDSFEIVEPVKVVEIVPEEKIDAEIPPVEETEESIVTEIPSELPENAPEEAVSEEVPALEEEKPQVEIVTEIPAPSEEEIPSEIVNEIAPALSVEPETVVVNVPEEEPTVDFDSEIEDVVEKEVSEIPGVVREEIEGETDEYQPIVLVPVDDNPPEGEEEQVGSAESNDDVVVSVKVEETVSPAANVITENPAENKVASAESKSFESYITTEDKFQKNSWYIQIGTFGNKENLNNIANKFGEKYPLAIIELNGGKSYRVLVGPLNVDEYRSVHEKFKSYGYKDSFLKKIK